MPTLALKDRDLKRLSTARAQEDFIDSSFTAGGSFGVRVSRAGRKTFFLIYSSGGRRHRVTLGAYPVIGLNEARDRAIGLLRERAEGRDPRAALPASGETFGSFCRDALDRDLRKRCRPSTLREYERIIRVELLPRWERARIGSLRQSDVVRLIDEIAEVRESPVMANRVRALLSKLFGIAIRRGLVRENPLQSVPPVPTPPPRERILSDGEITSLFRALSSERPAIATLFKLLLLTGERPGALMAMRWSEVGLDEWRKPPVRRSAGSQDRVVALSRLARSLLEELRRELEVTRGGDRPLEHVFSANGRTPLVYIRRAAKRISERMGGEPFSPADLRRTAAHHLARLGARADVLDEILGRAPRERRFPGPPPGSLALESRKVLEAWSRHIERLTRRSGTTPGGPRRRPPRSRDGQPPDARGSGKIIPLFPDDR